MLEETYRTEWESGRSVGLPGDASPECRIVCGPPPNSLEDLLRGGLETLAIERVGTVCTLTFRRPTRRRRPLSRKERLIFERLVRGSCQKEIAYDLGVALTTVSAHVRFALQKLGLENWEAAVLVVAGLERGTPLDGPASGDGSIGAVRVVLSEQDLARLTDAERTVVLFALDGCTNAQIAVMRRSSPRTVANQVASAFRKLGVRCRLELIRCLACVSKPEVRGLTPAVVTMGDVARAPLGRLEPAMVVAK